MRKQNQKGPKFEKLFSPMHKKEHRQLMEKNQNQKLETFGEYGITIKIVRGVVVGTITVIGVFHFSKY